MLLLGGASGKRSVLVLDACYGVGLAFLGWRFGMLLDTTEMRREVIGQLLATATYYSSTATVKL
jgi:hypothetical protein